MQYFKNYISYFNKSYTIKFAYRRYHFIYILVVARGFSRCKPNRIPDKMPENKMSENGKPEKMPDNLNCTLTLTGSGPIMSLFTHTHTHTLSLSLDTLSPSLLINTFLSFCTLSLHLFLLPRTLPLSISPHTLFLSLHTLPLSLF